ncbi:hypothetical protein MTO96_045586 [Rhipicephalus appendiculatus]
MGRSSFESLPRNASDAALAGGDRARIINGHCPPEKDAFAVVTIAVCESAERNASTAIYDLSWCAMQPYSALERCDKESTLPASPFGAFFL